MRWSEGPGCPDGGKAPNPELVMHASLTIGGGTLMLADEPESAPGRPTGSSTVCLHFDDLADMAQRFEALSTGGKITMPLQETFWKATFGMLTDAFGVSWMFQCPKTA